MDQQNIFSELKNKPTQVVETFAVIVQMKTEAEMWYDFLAEIDLKQIEKIAKKSQELPGYCAFLKKLYHGTALYPSLPLLNRFSALGFKKNELRWFISVSDIYDACMDSMQSLDFVMNIGEVCLTVNEYLRWKIWDTILKHYDFVSTVNRSTTNLAASGIFKYLKRRKDGMVNPFKKISGFDKMMNEIFEPINDSTSEARISDRDLVKTAKGDVELIHIKSIFMELFIPNKEYSAANISLRNKCLQFFPLARLIMRDHICQTEEEFHKSNDRKRKRGEEPSYMDKYKEYQIDRVKTLLGI